MAFDPATGQMVLFGGYDESGYLGDTWTYDGSNWTRQSPATSPSARYGASMAFDPETGLMVLFGGIGNGEPTNDTWTWDGTTWTEQSPDTTPSGRVNASMAFDATTGEMVLFGGQDEHGPTSETWTYDGANWAEQRPATSPPALKAASMAFDSATGLMVLFGGDHGGDGGSLRRETWTYDGSTWTEQLPATSPPKRAHASMAFDPASGQIVLFGGNEPLSRNDTWTYDGEEWTEQTPPSQPSARAGAAMAFDPETSRLVLFGGLEYEGYPGDTWTYGEPAAGPNPPGHPRARLAPPPNGRVFWIGEEVPTTFSCEDVAGGPGIESCTDSDGASAPTGALDTASLGEHTYAVTAVSKNGAVGITEVTYTVVKARPYISPRASAPVPLGGPIFATAELEFGHNPGGTISFRAYGPEDDTCAGPPAYTSAPVPVSGNGRYVSSPDFTPTLSGTYRFTAEYSGDVDNEPRSSECWWSNTSVTVGQTPSVLEEAPSEPEPTPEPAPTPPVDPRLITPLLSQESDPSPAEAASSPSPSRPDLVVSYGISHSGAPHRDDGARYTFDFVAGHQGSTFYCRLDNAAFAPCHSPTAYQHLRRGHHRFAVRAADATGVESPTRVIRFFVGERRR